jgi:hypothetical protein
MTKRRNPSPYPHPPTEFCRELMTKGWRRCYAEGIDVVRLALAHADDPDTVATWAIRAARALSAEPVLVGAIHRLVADQAIASQAFELFIAAPKPDRAVLARFFLAAARQVRVERLLERDYLESLEYEVFDEVLD